MLGPYTHTTPHTHHANTKQPRWISLLWGPCAPALPDYCCLVPVLSHGKPKTNGPSSHQDRALDQWPEEAGRSCIQEARLSQALLAGSCDYYIRTPYEVFVRIYIRAQPNALQALRARTRPGLRQRQRSPPPPATSRVLLVVGKEVAAPQPADDGATPPLVLGRWLRESTGVHRGHGRQVARHPGPECFASCHRLAPESAVLPWATPGWLLHAACRRASARDERDESRAKTRHPWETRQP